MRGGQPVSPPRAGKQPNAPAAFAEAEKSYDRLVKRWGSAGLALVLIAVLGSGLWGVASPGLAESERFGFAMQVALFGLLSGSVTFWLGRWAGRKDEREAARKAADELRARRERLDAQLAARRAELEQITAGRAENPRLTGGMRS
jgi:hypothetical protein